MKIYIDSECRCFTEPAKDRREFETDFFDGKCREFAEGYRCIPEGETWVRSDGMVFHGESITPWRPWYELYEAQREYEREQLAVLQAENETLIADMAQMVDEVYQSDMEMMGL